MIKWATYTYAPNQQDHFRGQWARKTHLQSLYEVLYSMCEVPPATFTKVWVTEVVAQQKIQGDN